MTRAVQSSPTLEPADLEVLQRAARHLEHPSLAARLSSVIGTPVEIALKLLPKAWYKRINGAAETALHKALRAAIDTFHIDEPVRASEGLYRLMGATTGMAGGLFGLPGLLVELPVTTTLMLRAVADIARSEGEDLQDPDTQRACVEVVALGGRAESDDAADTGYYEVRLALAMYAASTASFVAQNGVSAEGAPLLFRLGSAVASRFGLVVSQKTAAQLVPLAGAVGAAAVNVIFVSHFEDMARHHFAIRRLERRYGGELVKAAYRQYLDSRG